LSSPAPPPPVEAAATTSPSAKRVAPPPTSHTGPVIKGKVEEDLLAAAEIGDHDALLKALGAGANTRAVDDKQYTALHWAAKEGRVDDIESLAAAGCPLDEQNKIGATPLILAASSGWDDCIGALLRVGASASVTTSKGKTALMVAQERRGKVDDKEEIARLDACIKLLSAPAAPLAGRLAAPTAPPTASTGVVKSLFGEPAVGASMPFGLSSGFGFQPLLLAAAPASATVGGVSISLTPPIATGSLFGGLSAFGGLSVAKPLVPLFGSGKSQFDFSAPSSKQNASPFGMSTAFGTSAPIKPTVSTPAQEPALKPRPAAAKLSLEEELLFAAEIGDEAAALAALQTGAQATLSDDRGNTALHWSAHHGLDMALTTIATIATNQDLRNSVRASQRAPRLHSAMRTPPASARFCHSPHRLQRAPGRSPRQPLPAGRLHTSDACVCGRIGGVHQGAPRCGCVQGTQNPRRQDRSNACLREAERGARHLRQHDQGLHLSPLRSRRSRRESPGWRAFGRCAFGPRCGRPAQAARGRGAREGRAP
jgi:ankyrin repeat protein